MTIAEVTDVISKIAAGLKDVCVECLQNNADVIRNSISEQLYSGLDGDGKHLTPTYLDDPYFTSRKTPWYHYDEDTGKEYHGAVGYKQWKMDITPPEGSEMLGLPPRPDNVPNLFIDGTFHNSLEYSMGEESVIIISGDANGSDIVAKYGPKILTIGSAAVRYFNQTYMWPAIDEFYQKCGYK